MTQAERIEIFVEFLDTPVAGVPTLWIVTAVFVITMVYMIHVIVGTIWKSR